MDITLLAGLVALTALGVLAPCLAAWWSANWERVRMAEKALAADEVAERLP
jgi:hypothetical protein